MTDNGLSWIHGNPKECFYSYYSSGIDRSPHYIVTRRDSVPCSNYQVLIDTVRGNIKHRRECYVEKSPSQIKSFTTPWANEIQVKIEPNDDDDRHDFELFKAKF